LGLVVLLIGGVGVWMWWRVAQARQRISAHIGDEDLCATLTIAPADMEHATADQRKLIAMRKKECVEKRAREERERLKKEKRAAYERACAALAEALDKKTVVGAVEGASKEQLDVAKRIADRKLSAEDLGPTVPKLPCGDTPSKATIDASFTAAVLASQGWLEHAELSKKTRSILSENASKLSKELKVKLSENAEQKAAKALMEREPATVAKAKHLCGLKKLLSLKRGAFCRKFPAP